MRKWWPREACIGNPISSGKIIGVCWANESLDLFTHRERPSGELSKAEYHEYCTSHPAVVNEMQRERADIEAVSGTEGHPTMSLIEEIRRTARSCQLVPPEHLAELA